MILYLSGTITWTFWNMLEMNEHLIISNWEPNRHPTIASILKQIVSEREGFLPAKYPGEYPGGVSLWLYKKLLYSSGPVRSTSTDHDRRDDRFPVRGKGISADVCLPYFRLSGVPFGRFHGHDARFPVRGNGINACRLLLWLRLVGWLGGVSFVVGCWLVSTSNSTSINRTNMGLG